MRKSCIEARKPIVIKIVKHANFDSTTEKVGAIHRYIVSEIFCLFSLFKQK